MGGPYSKSLLALEARVTDLEDDNRLLRDWLTVLEDNLKDIARRDLASQSTGPDFWYVIDQYHGTILGKNMTKSEAALMCEQHRWADIRPHKGAV